MRRGIRAALLGLAACGGSGASGAPDGSTSVDATVVVQTMGDDSGVPFPQAPLDDGGDAGDPSNLPDPPPMACDGGGLANGCPSPPPACIDAGVAVSYQNGQCTAGMCSWSKVALDCARAGGTSCVAGSKQNAVVDAGSGADGGVLVAISGCLFSAPPAPAPTETACSTSASADASDVCPLPQSTCADGRWLVFYDNGQCTAGTCVWETRYYACTTGCSGHSCLSFGTPPPPI